MLLHQRLFRVFIMKQTMLLLTRRGVTYYTNLSFVLALRSQLHFKHLTSYHYCLRTSMEIINFLSVDPLNALFTLLS